LTMQSPATSPGRLAGFIERFMSEDHARIDRLLAASEVGPEIDGGAYADFRHDLLRHIAQEEKILLPYARERRGGQALSIARDLRADHGRIAKLLVPSPTREGIRAMREILVRHNEIEEGPSGLYATCDELAGADATEVVARLRAHPRVPVANYYDGPLHRRT